MERFSYQGGNVLLGYSPHQSQRSFENPISSSSSDPEIDFNDVFGGPPRRFSSQEMRSRYSFSEQINSGSFQGEERLSLSGPRDKAVFGEEIGIRRQCPDDDFFDDIFKGDQSYSSPRRSVWDRDSYGSNPVSRVMSPARPLPPKSEPFGTSLPAQFSLPATKLTKAMEFQGFGSGNRSPYKFKDSISNYSTSVSRFSNQAVQGQDELESDDRLPYDQSSLSDQFSLNTEEPSGLGKSDEAEKGNRLKKYEKSAGPPSNISQFHFSIYKWAGKGIPLRMHLRGRNGSKSKEWDKLERCLSSNGRIQSDSIVSELLTVNIPDANSLLQSDSISAETKSSIANVEKQGDITTEYAEQPCQVFEQAVLDVPESKSHNSVHRTTVNVSGTIFVSNKNVAMENGISEAKKEVQKTDLKPPHSVFNDKLEEQGNDNTTRKGEEKESTNLADVNVDFNQNVAKHDVIKKNSVSADVKVQSKNSGDTFGRSRVKGKVYEYVKIFDQEADSKPQRNVHTQNKSFRWKATKVHEATNEARTSTKPLDKKMFQPNVNKTSDSSFMVRENREQSGKQYSPTRTTINKPESFSDGPKDTFENIDDLFQGDFLIEELSHEEEKSLQSDQDCDVFKVSDDKIRQWSNGKKGNIRSLLSTLQYVLWPDSGWKPVPLVDIIEGSQVKRAYQKALLCLHPDKLQQKGAASHQKYIAEKVFDILQEAWDHFSTPDPL